MKQDSIKRDSIKGRVLQSLEKVRSPRRVDFLIEPDDEEDQWFVEIVEYQKKSGEVKNTSTITMDDLDDFIERYIRLKGYHKVEFNLNK